MIESPQSIQVSCGGVAHNATVGWRYEDRTWTVTIESAEFEPVEGLVDTFEPVDPATVTTGSQQRSARFS